MDTILQTGAARVGGDGADARGHDAAVWGGRVQV
jgi:hypothetical protein